MERLNPLNDYLFKKLMGEKGDEEQLLAFLNAVLVRTNRDNLVSVEIREDKELTAAYLGDKASVLDVRATTDNGTRINIEVQLRDYDNMDRRSLFYWSREYTQSIKRGDDYIELPDIIAINIINYQFIDLPDFHTSFHLWEDQNKSCRLTDALEIHFLDMVKFRQLKERDLEKNSLHRWLSYLDPHTPSQIVKEVVQMDNAIKRTDEKLWEVTADPETRRMYDLRSQALSDYNSAIGTAERKGRKEGRKEGRLEGRREGRQEGRLEEKMELAREALQEGLPMETIAKLTKLDIMTIKNIQKELP